MQYVVSGKLEASICENCTATLQGTTVHLYPYEEEEASLSAATSAPSKASSFSALGEGELPDQDPVASSDEPVGSDGSYEVRFGEEAEYEGGPLTVAVRLTHLPGDDPEEGVGLGRDVVQFTLGHFEWSSEETGERRSHAFDYRIPDNFYCKLLEALGRRVICGHVLAQDGEPLSNAQVQAFDADITQDDPIGTATTGSSGRFLIYYTEDDFDDTPISLFEIELVGGPDCYFKVDYAGQRVIDEERADGRKQGRENRGHCTCVTLRSEEVRVDVDPEDIPVWTTVYEFDIRTDFTNEGYTADGNHQVFGGAVPLRGNVPLTTSSGDPLKYRFLAAAWEWPGSPAVGTPPSVKPSDSDFQPITDIARTRVGTAIEDGYGWGPVYIDSSDLGPDGFVTLKGKSVEIRQWGPGQQSKMVTLDEDNFVHALDLMRIRTGALTPPPANTGGNVEAGQQPSSREPVRRYRLRFQYFAGPDSPDKTTDDGTLDSIVLDNSPLLADVSLGQLAGDLCAEISGSVDVEYTADHPHLRSFDVVIRKNAGVVHDDGNSSLPDQEYGGNLSFRGDHGTERVDVSGDEPCAYEVVLRARTRHHRVRDPITRSILYRIC
jgi:hypothetical protein